MYYREYHTQFHIGITCGISKRSVCETIKEIEKSLLKEENHFETVLIDVTESHVERPEKNRNRIIRTGKSVILKKRRLLRINQTGRDSVQHLTWGEGKKKYLPLKYYTDKTVHPEFWNKEKGARQRNEELSAISGI